MMKKSMLAATAALTLAAMPACAEPKPASPPEAATSDADPALWVVKDADTTVYLFGTVHVLKPGLTWFDEAVKTAFDASDTLVLEMVEPDQATMGQLVAAKGINATGPSLSEQLPEGKRAAVAKAMTDAGVPAQAYERMKPWFAAVVATLAPVQKLGYVGENGPEKVLTAAAKSASKKVDALETAEQQLSIFDALPTKAQVTFLTSSVDQLPELPKTMESMVGTWAKGDPDGLARLMNDNLDDAPELEKALLTDRNARWAEWIDKRMDQPGTVFMAVGAGHLAGGNAVQTMLAKHGLKAERVKY
ncbi:MAG TPA: TraB/GumN family protein [Sphingomonas sp.]|jgi:hypothetical protein